MSDYKIFANHAHLFPEQVKKNGSLDALKALMYECEIEKAVCFAPFPDRLEENGMDKNTIKWIENELKNEPNLYPFGTIDFEKSDLKNQVREAKERGMYGLKIHPAYQEVRVDSPELFEVYDEAQAQKLFVSFHTGLHWYRIKEYQMLLFDEVAWNFPELKFSLEHIGGYSFFREALLVMDNNKRNGDNIYAGWTSINMERDEMGNLRQGPWSLTDDELCTVIHHTGAKRSILGLDFPYKNAEYIKASIERVKNLPISEEAKRGILGGNLEEALASLREQM